VNRFVNDQSSSTPIAIIGMGCMFPKARNLQGYWTNILNRVDAITEVPATHWRPEDYFDKDPKSPDRVYAARGGFLSPVDFPPLEFGITPNALEATDTTQLLGLMVAREALEDAGYGSGRDFDRSRVSVILGVTGTLELVIPLGARLGHPIWRQALAQAGVEDNVAEDVVQRISDSYVGWQEDSFPGLLGNVAAGRIANRLDLGGTNCVVDAACASSLSALHLATLELASGRCDMVLSGGLDTFNDIFMYMCFSKTPALSPTGNARPFDTKADGTILGEGLGVLVLKRLADAERDGDKIYAVIKAIGSSSDGKGNAIYAPNPVGQAKALRRAYQMAGVTPDAVELVEAHGTGTRAGDAAELSALEEVFQENGRKTQEPWCAVGSVKSQIGHTKAAAGAAGLIKAVLALHHRVLPPTIKVDQPAEVAASGPLYLNTEKRPWLNEDDHPRRAGVSSFGFGGSNFHCVLEEYPSPEQEIHWDGCVQILPFSAKTKEELADWVARFSSDMTWDQLRHDAWRHRQEFRVTDPCRLLMLIEKDKTNLARLIANARTLLQKHSNEKYWSTPDGLYFGCGNQPGKLAFVFPGQGSQYVGMFRDLACQFPQMHKALAEANVAWRESNAEFENGPACAPASAPSGQGHRHGQGELDHSGHPQLSDLIYPRPAFDDASRSKHEKALRNTAVAQPALGAVSLGALRILEYFGVRADAVAGHSYGEFVALHAGGRFDAATLQSLSILRGRLMAGASDEADLGAMLAVRAPLEVVQEVLEKENLDLTLANKNAPQQYVLSGASREIHRAAGVLAEMSIENKNLPVSAAFHSRFVANVRQPLLSAIEKTPWNRPSVPVFANTTGMEYPDDDQSARRLLAGQLAEPVEFMIEIENMHASGVRTFLEVGPGNKLTGLIGAILKEKDDRALALDASSGKQSGSYDLARAIAGLAAFGHAVDLSRWDPDGSKIPASKPAFTVPICGANYVKLKNEGAAEERSKMQDRKLEYDKGRKDVPRKDVLMKDVNGTSAVAESTRSTQRSKQIANDNLPGRSSPGDAAFMHVLRTTQENLLALQRLSEQTAQVHRQFLEGQDRALQVFRDLLQQQQKLFGADLISPLSDSGSVETKTPPARPTPSVGATRAVVPTVSMETIPELSARASMEPATAPPAAPDVLPLKNVLLEVVAEKTGYPAEMLDLEMELDSDLGIDSIKRVEIFSALQERLPEAPAVKSEHLGTLRTLRQVVDFLSSSPDSGGIAPPESQITKIEKPKLDCPAPTENGQIQAILLQVVSEKTGYPAEMLELDMELDSDLGIDSIKRVEIFSALQEKLPKAPQVKSDHLGSLRTLRQVADFLSGEQSPEVPATLDVQPQIQELDRGAALTTAAPAKNGFHAHSATVPLAHSTLHRFLLTAGPISKESPRQKLHIPKGGEIWITAEGSGLDETLAQCLQERGFSARVVTSARGSTPAYSLAGLIVLAPNRTPPDGFLKETWGLLKVAAPGLRKAGKKGGSVFVTVSRMDGVFGLKKCCNPISGGLAGIAKTAGKEWPEVHCKAIDLAADWNDLQAAAFAIVEEIFLEGPEEVGLSRQGTVALSLSERALDPTQTSPNGCHSISKSEVVIVTGGARGVTAEVAVALAEAMRPTLILIGRSPEPKPEPDWLVHLTEESEIKKAILNHAENSVSPRELEKAFQEIQAGREIRRTIDRIEKVGDTVHYRSLDIRDKALVRTVLADIRARVGPVRGLVHGAGVLADRLIEDKTPEQFDQVYATKVTGLEAFLEILEPDKLKLLALFSSSTARFGRTGQVDYAAANEVLNKIAQRESQRRPHCRVLSINWGPWDGGMVTAPLKKIFAREGIGLIPLKAGADFLIQEINQTFGPTVEVIVLADPIHGKEEPLSSGSMSVAFERTLNVEEYPFLTSHVIDGKAVLPLAMMMEWLAHGALHGNPGMTFHGLDNVRVLRGVILEEGQSTTIRVLAGRAISKGAFTFVPVELQSVSVDKDTRPSTGIHARAEVILTTRMPAPDFQLPEIVGGPYSLDPEEIYSQLLFHGPHLQGITQVLGCSKEGISGRVAGAPAPAEWIQVPLRNTWLTDPLAIDAAFQLAVLWGFEQVGSASLPCFAGRYRQYRRSMPREGMRVVMQVKEVVAQRMTADFAFLDGEDQLVARIENYEEVFDAHLNQAFRRNQLPLRKTN
jgi:acyl transferase domain-containing protein/NAD(P)-dependent dehydrogenase (short-subunit alcohol dehydrogenase family)/acyl carrier protein